MARHARGAVSAFLTDWSLRDVVDLLIKLSPAITIVFGLLAAQVQWKRQQRLNAELIAKNHYREMLEHLLRNSNLVERGLTPQSLALLATDHVEFRRYVMLFAMVAFALQEIYFATDPRKNKHWGEVIRLFFDPFSAFMANETYFSAAMSSSVHPEFFAFTQHLLGEHSTDPRPAFGSGAP